MGADQHARERLAIVVRDLHEIFRIYHERPSGLKERLYRFRGGSYEEFHALQGASLEIRHGECVGIVGQNGSGKSTLLKCMARILPADEGEVVVNGRVATLLELGAGFHQDLSGRENIYLNGAILGLSRREIDEAFDSIVDFAGVRGFLDTPVRNYSSGMYVRLGFAIAVHVDPDILLVDEVLSVGDAAFQEKSVARMRSFKQRGKTVVLVSHDLASIESLCERTLVLHEGRVIFDGETEEALEHYREIVATGQVPDAPAEQEGRTGDFRARVTDVRWVVAGVVRGAPVPPGSRATVEVEVAAVDDLVEDGGLTVGVNVRREGVVHGVYETRTSWRGTYVAPPPPGASLHVTFALDLRLLTGTYHVDLLVGNATTNVIHDRWLSVVTFEVRGPEQEFGIAPLDAAIRIHNPDGIWPPESHPPPLEEGGPRHHSVGDTRPPPGADAPSGLPPGDTRPPPGADAPSGLPPGDGTS
jgi:ABC-type polysaccharide/polyol phosphate transport system ATPase subunit